MLIAAAELIAERGFSETRIADVARRVGASPALVIYYFGTKDSLLTAALRYSEEPFYTSCAEMLAKTPNIGERLENLARMTCVPDADEGITGTWGLWFDLWAQAFRHPDVARDRVELERRWRTTIEDVVKQGIEAGEIERGRRRASSRSPGRCCSTASRSRSRCATRASTPSAPSRSRCGWPSASSISISPRRRSADAHLRLPNGRPLTERPAVSSLLEVRR